MEGGFKRVKIEGQYLGRTHFRVYSANRSIRKGVVCRNFLELTEACIEKFDTGTSHFRVVLNEDGTEIDDEFFETLEPGTVLMVLKGHQTWTPEKTETISIQAQSHTQPNPSVQDKYKETKQCTETTESHTKQEDEFKGGQKPETASCTVGWKHYSFADTKYRLQRGTMENPDCSQKVLQLKKSLTYSETMDCLKNLYFKNGQNEQGNLNKMTCFLGTTKGEEVADSPNFSLGSLMEETKAKTKRIYLLTKPRFPKRRRSSDPDMAMDLSAASATAGPAADTSVDVQLSRKPIASDSSASAFPKISLKPKMTSKPVKQSPSDKVNPRGVSLKKKCPVCLKRDRDAFIMPCGDSICMTCGSHLRSSASGCPTCRGPVERVRLIFT